MLISAVYRGSNEDLSGVTFDTEKKTYKQWKLKREKWTHDVQKGTTLFSRPNDDFAVPGDMYFYHVYKHELIEKINELKNLGFQENTSMELTFQKKA